jgi:WD40 repeat protein
LEVIADFFQNFICLPRILASNLEIIQYWRMRLFIPLFFANFFIVTSLCAGELSRENLSLIDQEITQLENEFNELMLGSSVVDVDAASSSKDAEQVDQQLSRIDAYRVKINELKSRLRKHSCNRDADIECFLISRKLLDRLVALESNFPVSISFNDPKKFYYVPYEALSYSIMLRDLEQLMLSGLVSGNTSGPDLKIAHIDDKIGSKIIELLTLLSQEKSEKEILDKISEYKFDNNALIDLFLDVIYFDIPSLEVVLIEFIKRELYSKNEDLLKALLLKLPIELVEKLIIVPFVKSSREYSSFQMSLNGNRIVAKGQDNKLYLFDGNGREIKVNESDTQRNYSLVQISSDGSRIVAMGQEGKLYLFDGNGIEIKVDESDPQRNYSLVQISSDGSRIVAIGQDNKLYLFDGNGREIKVNESDPQRTYSLVQISSDGSRIVAIGQDGKLYLFDGNGEEIKIAEFDSQIRYDVVLISLDGNKIVARGLDNHIYVFDRDGKRLWYNDKINAVAFSIYISSNGDRILVKGTDKKFHLLSGDGNEIALVEFDSKRKYSRVRMSGDRIVAHGYSDDYIYVFDRDGRGIWSNKQRKYLSVEINSSGNRIIAHDNFDNVYVFDRDGNQLDFNMDSKQRYNSIQMSACGRKLVALGSDNKFIYLFGELSIDLFNSVLNKMSPEELDIVRDKLAAMGFRTKG